MIYPSRVLGVGAKVAVLAAALALHLLSLAPLVERGGQDFDAIHVYLPYAKRLLAEGVSFFLTEDSIQAPPFSYAWPALVGPELAAVKRANVAISCLLLIVVYRTATLWHSRLAGFLAAFAFALSPLLKPYLPTALTEPPFLFLLGVWIWGVSEWRLRDRAVYVYIAGVALGLALLTRASFFYGVLVLLPFLWRSRPAFAAHLIALTFPLAFLAKNLLVFGFPFYVTGAGNALYLGTSPLFRGYDPGYLGLVFDVGAVTGLASPLTMAADAKLQAAARLLLSSIDVTDLAAMYAQKLAAFLFVTNAETVGDVFVLRAWRVATLLLAAIGLAGLRDRWLRWLVAGVIVYQVAAHVPVLYNHRYSVGALDLWLTLLAGVGLAHLWQRRRAREIAATGAALAIGIAAAGHQVKNGGVPEPNVFGAPHVLLWESRAPATEIDVTVAPGFSDWFNHVLVIDSTPCGRLRLDYPDGRHWTVPMETDGAPHVHQVGLLMPRARISMDCAPGRTWTINRIAVYSARGGLALREELESPKRTR